MAPSVLSACMAHTHDHHYRRVSGGHIDSQRIRFPTYKFITDWLRRSACARPLGTPATHCSGCEESQHLRVRLPFVDAIQRCCRNSTIQCRRRTNVIAVGETVPDVLVGPQQLHHMEIVDSTIRLDQLQHVSNRICFSSHNMLFPGLFPLTTPLELSARLHSAQNDR